MLTLTRTCVVVLMLALCGRAVAQFGLPQDVTQSTTALSDAQKAQVDQHIDQQMARIESKEADKVKQAQEVMSGRRALIEPLNTQASVPFRLTYAEKLEPRLRALIQNGNEMQQVNALVISAELGTNRALSLIALGRTNAAPSIRFQAAAATRRLLDSLANLQSRAINDDDLKRLLQDTGNAMAAEKDPQVTAGQVAALAAGLSISTIRNTASQELADAVAGIVCTQKTEPLHPRVLESIGAAQGALRDQILNAGANVPTQLTKASADIAASCLVHARSVVSGQKLSPAKSDTAAGRAEYADFGGLTSSILQLTGQASTPKVAIPPHALTEDIKANNVQKDAAVVSAINDLVTAAVNGFKVDGDPCKKR